MPANALELNAAEALLELHFGPSRPSKDIKVEVEGDKRLPVSSHPNSDTPSPAAYSSPVVNTLQSARPCNARAQEQDLELNNRSSYDSTITHKSTDIHKDPKPRSRQYMDVQQVRQEESNTEMILQSPMNGESLYNPIYLARKHTSTQGSLTNDDDLSQNMSKVISGTKKDKMGVIVSVLYASINSLEMQLKQCQKNMFSPPRSELDPDVSTDVVQIEKFIQKNNIRRKSINCYTNSCKTVPIGEGYASVPARLLKQIDWTSYTGATRKLLTAVFSRRVLATHSLTGKPSPAFPGKPAKKRLNTDLVNDIVQTVVERCGVPESVVRTSITTKCADESKMYRSRQQQKQKQSYKSNQENVPPCRYFDDDSSDE